MRHVVALMFLSGCGEMAAPGFATDTQTSTSILYTVSAPYSLSGVSPVGLQGQLFTAVPQVGADPFRMQFSFQGRVIDFSVPLMWMAINENVPVTTELEYNDTNVMCSSWNGTTTVTAAAPHWHIAINASCNTVGGLNVHGDWQEYH